MHLHNIITQLKENAVSSDTLLTVDLKNGSKIKIGTHTITLVREQEYEVAGHWQWLLSYLDMDNLWYNLNPRFPCCKTTGNME